MKKRLEQLIGRYDAAVWIRIIGTLMVTMAGFMMRPFMMFYLHDRIGGSILLPMVVVGLQPVTGMICSLWSGGLSDKYGRKPIMMAALVLNTASMCGFLFAESVWAFAALSIVNGIGNSMFGPAASAQIADVVPEKQRAEVFAALHTALNVGAAAGPTLGLIAFTSNPKLVFGFSAVGFLLYTLLVHFKVQETFKRDPASSPASTHQARPKLSAVELRPIVWLTAFAIPISLLYSQVETVLPLHLRDQFPNDYKWMLSTLLTLNGVTVTLLQIWVARRTERYPVSRIIFCSYMLMALVALGYGFAPSFAILLLSELLFTAGEMLNGPHIQKAVSMMASPENRGRYFSIFGLNWGIGRSLGPISFGFVYEQWSAQTSFLVIALLIAATGVTQAALLRRITAKPKDAPPQTAPSMAG